MNNETANLTFGKITLETCCGSFEDARLAYEAGVDRIELNSGLELGGLTPSLGAVQLCQSLFKIPLIAMIRPRGGGFCYSSLEFEQMLKDAELILEAGAQGLAFGILREDGSLDEERNGRLAHLVAQEKGREAVFHMAFDVCTDDAIAALTVLKDLGITRLLTTGRKANALAGAEHLRDYITANQIEILPGGGIRTNNAAEVLKCTKTTQLHGRYHIERDGSQVIDGAGLKEYVKYIRFLESASYY
ncbi:copper homeostasis protein CutC [Clostridia bacterium]|nr:copper homeostasis protein CutC [Clostridia bacterium]